jgi:hypothetical protein
MKNLTPVDAISSDVDRNVHRRQEQSAAAQAQLKRWPVPVGALTVQMILGTVYAFSVFVKPPALVSQDDLLVR